MNTHISDAENKEQTNECMRKCSTSRLLQRRKLKQHRFHFTPERMAFI